MYLVWNISVHAVLAERVVVTGRRAIDSMLQHGGVRHSEADDNETAGDSRNRAKRDTYMTQKGVDKEFTKRAKNQNCDGIQIHEKIVRNAVCFHGTRLRDHVGEHLKVCKPEEWVE